MANAAKIVMDIRPGKGFTTAQSNEHLRQWTEKGWAFAVKNGNYDRTRTRLNFEVVGGKVVPVDAAKSIPQRICESLRARGIKDPNEGLGTPTYRTVVNFIFGGSRERMHELAFGDQPLDLTHGADNSALTRREAIEQWAIDVYNFAAAKWGEENIAACVVHLDEMNPHIHLTLVPVKDGAISFRKVFAGKDIYEFKERTRRLHDEFSQVMEKWGLARGTSIAETGAKHRSTEEYRRELSEQCTLLEQQKASLEESVEANKSLLKRLRTEVLHAEKRVKGLTTMVANHEQKQAELTTEMEQLTASLQAGLGDREAQQEQLDRQRQELERVTASLADKREKLADANQKLAEFNELMEQSRERAKMWKRQVEKNRLRAEQSHRLAEQSQQRAEHYQSELREAAGSFAEQVRFRVSDAMSSFLLEAMRAIYPDPDNAPNEVLQTIAAHGEEVLKCAAMLFAGYVDGATTFAKDHGGGGTTSDLPWGRKDDEDDREWARRCLMQASRMMRPASGKSVKRKQ